MSLAQRRTFYRVRNNAYGWVKLGLAALALGFLALRVMHPF